jgi:hypothetical protein
MSATQPPSDKPRTAEQQHKEDIQLIMELAKDYGIEIEPSVSLTVTFQRIVNELLERR